MTALAQLGMEKSASPAWVKMLPRLSSAARNRLRTFLPSGATRQIGRVPLGVGNEGRVMPGFTGGSGETAIKQFDGIARSRALSEPGSYAAAQEAIANRFRVMSDGPAVFPKLHARTANGFVMERLRPASQAAPDGMFMEWTNEAKAAMPGFLKRMKSHAASPAEATRISRYSERPPSQFELKLPTGAVDVGDINTANVMLDSAGVAKIADPVIGAIRPHAR